MNALFRIWALVRARTQEYFRDTSTFGWNFLFPVLLVIVLAFAFEEDQAREYIVAIDQTPTELSLPFIELTHIQVEEVDDLRAAQRRISQHTLGILISLEQKKYWVNPESTKGFYLEQALLQHLGKWKLERSELSGEPVRYLDWVIPGVLTMNIIFSALWGVGYVIVRYRRFGVLKRLSATPVYAYEFLLAQIISRLWVLVISNLIVFVGLDYFFDFLVVGSYWDLFVVYLLGGICLMSVSLLVISRVRSEELAGGLLNTLTWPMLFLSGLWFSIEDSSPWLVWLSDLLPSTHIINAARAIALDGEPLSRQGLELGILTAITIVSIALGSKLFKWE